jgi:hypothetical protein
VVLALSFFSDQAAGLDTIFMVFTAVLLVTVPLVLMIPEAGQPLPAPMPRPVSRLPVAVATTRPAASPARRAGSVVPLRQERG